MSAVPGTFEPGYVEPRIVEISGGMVGDALRASGAKGVKFFTMGECRIIKAREPSGVNGEMRWHMTISCLDRHPTWDEIKTARYRLLPAELCFAMFLPPPEMYVNVPAQDHVFQLYEVEDEAAPWSTG